MFRFQIDKNLVSARRTPRPGEPEKQSYTSHKDARAGTQTRAYQVP